MFRTVALSLAFAFAVGLGMELVVSGPDAPQRWTPGEMAKWGKVIGDNNIKPD